LHNQLLSVFVYICIYYKELISFVIFQPLHHCCRIWRYTCNRLDWQSKRLRLSIWHCLLRRSSAHR